MISIVLLSLRSTVTFSRTSNLEGAVNQDNNNNIYRKDGSDVCMQGMYIYIYIFVIHRLATVSKKPPTA